jgi:hypothetical protein
MFFDVNANTPHANEIWWCAQHQLTTGWQDGPKRWFHGELPVARQDMAAFMHRLALHGVSPATPGKAGDDDFFFDVTNRTPHAGDIAWLAGNGIAQGWESPRGGYEFRGTAFVTRADMAAFMHRLYNKVLNAKPSGSSTTPSAS